MIEISLNGFDTKNFDRKSNHIKYIKINSVISLNTNFDLGMAISKQITCNEHLMADFSLSDGKSSLQNQFDLFKFDIKKDTVKVLRREIVCTENLQFTCCSAQVISVSLEANISLNTTFSVVNDKLLEVTSSESLNSHANIVYNKVLEIETNESLNTNFYLGMLMNKSFTNTFNLNTNFYLGMLITPKPMVLSNSLCTNITLTINMFKSYIFSELLNCEVLVDFLEYIICNIDVTLYPGHELRIDSDLFNVMLNGQNAIHLQRGDWIYLDRNSTELLLEAGTGGRLDGQIIYQERYL